MGIRINNAMAMILIIVMVMGGLSGIMVPGGGIAHAAAVAEFAGGDGITEATAFEIKTADQLNAVRNHLGTVSAVTYFKLVDDVDLSAYSTTDAGKGWEPIGTDLSPFYGIIDGNDHTITGLTMNRSTDFVGLFGQTGAGSSIKNMKLKDVIIKGQHFSGGLVGSNNGGDISNSYVTGSVTGAEQVGGLVGSNNGGDINDSYVTGSVIGGNYYAGGLVGSNYKGDISNCYFTGDVSGGSVVGGMAGNNNGGDISNSYTTGSVSGRYDFVGGMVGYNTIGDISNSYATGSVSGSGNRGYVGGLLGYNYQGGISNSYATGSVRGNYNVGGLIGSNGKGIISGSFYDLTTTGQHDSGKGMGLITEDMKLQSKYVNWRFPDVWAIDSLHNNGYPYLQVFQVNLNYDGNGNTGGDAPIDGHLYSSGVTASVYSGTVNLVKTNYTFDGWNTLANGRGKSYKAAETFTMTSNKTLYAKWKPINYTVSFVVDGGSVVSDVKADYNTAIIAPTAPTKANYSFGGWYKESTLTTTWDFTTDKVLGATTLYAKWTLNKYTVSFEVNGGSDVSDVKADYNTAITAPTAPTKANYSFGGWYKESTLTNTWDFTTDKVLGATTLYAKWTLNNYTVSFLVDGGSIVSDVKADYNTAIISPTAPTKANYSFGGWYKESTLMKTWDFTTDKVLGATTLYAKWKSTIATLTSTIGTVSTGGTSNEAITNIPYGTTLAALKTAITQATNATFEIYEADGTTVATVLASGKKVIVTAQDGLTKVTYTVSVNAAPSNGGSGDGSTTPIVAIPTVVPTPTSVPTVIPTPTPKSFYKEKVNVDVIKALVEKAKSAPALTFKDVPKDSPTAKAIELATKLGIVKGYADASFHTNATITRAEFATMLVKALGLTSEGDSSFKDTKGHWAADAIATLKASGIIYGYLDGTFKPNQTISRAEIVAMLSKVINTPFVKSAKFNDVAGHWAEAEIDTLSDMGIVKVAADGSFKPNASATRFESLLMVLRMLNISLGLSLDIE
ncbi:hypothetical protein GCM10008018_21980 [Paenibacillus marchantiophytorum]|uniref:SLH domain-containing protein n=1 Tax=Paenibacillus marchantiophytorum TaxID=1619310 RepID=A0ABQ1EKF1_9BACL|nr:InlB B-repeat-containing protein [Paenibacillus marchantiophytorum]GFZ76066.1 hypothetical protein GCM10008018_21980 [Paenibacillus marchantiophytorum]